MRVALLKSAVCLCALIASNAALAHATSSPVPIPPPPTAPDRTEGAAQANAKKQGPQADQPNASGEIIVTARRTAERLQDVPVAVTALTGALVADRNLRTVSDIEAVTPSLTFTTTNGQGSKAAVAIRGQRQSGSGIQVDPSVGVYVDDVYMGRASIDTSLFDLQDVQILKGPQGTLFGRNTTGGAVLVNTKRPGNYLGGFVTGEIEAPWGYNLEGALNVPLADGIALRVAGVRQYHRGYTQNVSQNLRMDDRNRWGGRASLGVRSGRFGLLLVGEYYKWHENGLAMYPLVRVPVPANPAFDAALAAQAAANYLNDRKANTTLVPFVKGRNYYTTAVATYDLTDKITFKNIISYAATMDTNNIDYDATVVPVLSTFVEARQHQFSEEAQIQGKSFENSLQWIFGAYYFDEWGTDEGRSNVFSNPNTTLARNRNFFYARNVGKSLYGHLSYTLPVPVVAHLFGGARRGDDIRHMTFGTGSITAAGLYNCTVVGTGAGMLVPDPGLAKFAQGCKLPTKKSFPSTTWDLGADVKPSNDVLLYASASRGYRTGGFNGRATLVAQQLPFDPETVTNYEIGMKFSGNIGNGMHATLDVAAYHAQYSNIQQNVIFVANNGNLTSNIINAAQGRVNGLEVEGNIRVVPALTLGGFFSLTDAKYTKFTQAKAGGGVQDLSSNHYAGVPRTQWGASLAWDIYKEPSLGEFRINTDYHHQSEFWLDPITQPAGDVIAGYGVWNASLDLKNAFGSRATVQVYVKNILDKTYGNGGFSTIALGFASQTLGDPRVFGLGVHVPFGGE